MVSPKVSFIKHRRTGQMSGYSAALLYNAERCFLVHVEHPHFAN
uniref:Uncharacterized protein n=1 Tax=Anguilla anguilla TaxID=7936 RepID=A0A0E9PP52_ANGAN